jgi:hypothetical protein
MLILRGDTANTSIGGFIAGGVDDKKIALNAIGSIAITSYLENEKLKEVIVGKDTENKDIKATGLYLSTNGQPTGATVFIRAINCAFIITRFMIIFIEKDPAKEAIVEFINPTFNSNTGFLSTIMVNKTANSEIKLSLKNEDKTGFDSTDLTNELSFSISPYATNATTLLSQINKFMKIHDPDRGKRNYLIDFSFPSSGTYVGFKAFNLKQTPAEALSSSTLSMSFEKLVDIFSQALIEDDLDLSGDRGELNALKNKNKKLLQAIDESKKYLNSSKKNLTGYENNMPIIK